MHEGAVIGDLRNLLIGYQTLAAIADGIVMAAATMGGDDRFNPQGEGDLVVVARLSVAVRRWVVVVFGASHSQ